MLRAMFAGFGRRELLGMLAMATPGLILAAVEGVSLIRTMWNELARIR